MKGKTEVNRDYYASPSFRHRFLFFIPNIIVLWFLLCLFYFVIGRFHNLLFPYDSSFDTYYFDNWGGVFFWIALLICIIFLFKKDKKIFYSFSRKFFFISFIVSLIVYIVVNSFYVLSTENYKKNRLLIITSTYEMGGYSVASDFIRKDFRWNTEKSYIQCKELAENNNIDAILTWTRSVRCGLWCTKIPLATWSRYRIDTYYCEDEVSVEWNNMGCLMDLEMWYENSKFCQTFDNFDYCEKYWCDDNWWRQALIIFLLTLLIAFWIDTMLKNNKKKN